ncbi:MAG TPA: transcription-repair coupling factor [Bacteroidales bacterium]|nr:transcription-repair coupling factor [Bacteroidales bacterium]
MKVEGLINLYKKSENIFKIVDFINLNKRAFINLSGLNGSSIAFVAAAVIKSVEKSHVFILSDKEESAFFYNDLEALFKDINLDFFRKKILFFPTSYNKSSDFNNIDQTNLLQRTEVLKRFQSRKESSIIVTYPEALCEKVVTASSLKKNTFKLAINENIPLYFLVELLSEYGFLKVDFVVEPGQYAVRGGIIDVFSYSNDKPYRIEFYDDKIASIRTFDPATQLSFDELSHITIISNILSSNTSYKERISFLDFLNGEPVLWVDNIKFVGDKINNEITNILSKKENQEDLIDEGNIENTVLINKDDFFNDIKKYNLIEFNSKTYNQYFIRLEFETSPQPSFNKNFTLLFDTMADNYANGYQNFILTSSYSQANRFKAILEDLKADNKIDVDDFYITVPVDISKGFYDKTLKLACFTDHQIFERYHRYRLKDNYDTKQSITIKELYNLNPGDYVTHIDHGIGRFAGLEKIEINGKLQEAIKLVYQNNDLLYVSIHSLHRIAKYVGREGVVPTLDKLGGNIWTKIKNRTKQRVKDIAKDLITLYAKRRLSKGFEFSPDTYLQHELEASFFYEDTPDQIKATAEVKKDMEAPYPMDRLICGDVGFGKTEIAIRAAFKAVADNKQVAVLVPTTILALQHFKTFSERLKNLPCKIEYLNRFKSKSEQKNIIQDIKSGKIDIIIATTRLLSKDIEFKDLGLLIVDEEQKFGVADKEKLRQLRVNIDTLTLTATPIPRTLQLSLMGARDLSILKTPPLNRYPIKTELCSFDEEVIKNAINYEISRGGQVFFVHNRIENIVDVAKIIQKFCPYANIAVAHGKLNGNSLEKIMLDFIEGKYDVLVSTTIIESGLDIPNANTIIINDAHNYGLSDLHQLRGRVGRTNKKAFCYLLSPPLASLSNEARKRLKAMEEYSELGSGFNIAMRDLDIRGAGNILGAEQSGFISEIGFEMYQKILDEAINELKETEFSELFVDEKDKSFVKECYIETDLELMIPDYYVSNMSERIRLYKELDNIENENDLQNFANQLIDRFGAIPSPTLELFNIVKLRWLARKLGFEKIILKNNKMTLFFIANQQSGYFATKEFKIILEWINKQVVNCRLKQNKDKLSIEINNVLSAANALKIFIDLEESILKTLDELKTNN